MRSISTVSSSSGTRSTSTGISGRVGSPTLDSSSRSSTIISRRAALRLIAPSERAALVSASTGWISSRCPITEVSGFFSSWEMVAIRSVL